MQRKRIKKISLRLPVKTLDALRKEATEKGIKYQPYIRQLLVDHVQGSNLESRVQRLEKKWALD
jgi:predicted DNA binding CopG/RHH family protein